MFGKNRKMKLRFRLGDVTFVYVGGRKKCLEIVADLKTHNIYGYTLRRLPTGLKQKKPKAVYSEPPTVNGGHRHNLKKLERMSNEKYTVYSCGKCGQHITEINV